METEIWSGFEIPEDTCNKVRSLVSILSIAGVLHIKNDILENGGAEKGREVFDCIRRISNMNSKSIDFFESGVEAVAVYKKKVPVVGV